MGRYNRKKYTIGKYIVSKGSALVSLVKDVGIGRGRRALEIARKVKKRITRKKHIEV